MKRFTRRMIAVVLGLVLGWWAAAFVPMGATIFAGDDQSSGPASLGGHGDGDADHEDDGKQAAEDLIPHRNQIPWLRQVIFGVVALFVAAIVLGIPAMKLKGPDPPDPGANDSG